MCGFVGIYYRSGHKQSQHVPGLLGSVLRHRGPDDTGHYQDSHVELLFNRLAIIDLSESGHQPMSNEDGTIWLVFNGEIYNYIECRAALIVTFDSIEVILGQLPGRERTGRHGQLQLENGALIGIEGSRSVRLHGRQQQDDQQQAAENQL